jgi:hypothetical protein
MRRAKAACLGYIGGHQLSTSNARYRQEQPAPLDVGAAESPFTFADYFTVLATACF